MAGSGHLGAREKMAATTEVRSSAGADDVWRLTTRLNGRT
jgi:hypothetical protein